MQTVTIRWLVQPYIAFGDQFVFVAGTSHEGQTVTKGNFTATLVEINNKNGIFGDITTTLIIPVYEIADETSITCDGSADSHDTLYIASKYVLSVRKPIHVYFCFRFPISSYKC